MKGFKWKKRESKGLDTFTKKKDSRAEKMRAIRKRKAEPSPDCILHKKGELKQTKTSIKTKKRGSFVFELLFVSFEFAIKCLFDFKVIKLRKV